MMELFVVKVERLILKNVSRRDCDAIEKAENTTEVFLSETKNINHRAFIRSNKK